MVGPRHRHRALQNLIDWSDQRFVPVMEHEPDAQNCWAPEIFFDDDRERYLICVVDDHSRAVSRDRSSETAGLSRGDRANHRIYYVETRDFRTFSRAKLLYDGGFNVIDAFIVKAARDRYVMVVKDETLRPTPKKHLRVTEAKRPDGPYGPASAPVSIDWVEGPSALKVGTDWIVYYDEYTRQAVRRDPLAQSHDLGRRARCGFPSGSTSRHRVPRAARDCRAIGPVNGRWLHSATSSPARRGRICRA